MPSEKEEVEKMKPNEVVDHPLGDRVNEPEGKKGMNVIHCPDCGGVGKRDINKCVYPGCVVYYAPEWVKCERCSGTGHLII